MRTSNAPGSPMTQADAGLAADPASLGQLRRTASRNDRAAVEGAARAFESLMIGQMLRKMRTTQLADGIFDSRESKLFQDLFDQQLAAGMSEGQGLGIRTALMRQLDSGPGSTQARDGRELKLPERNPSLRPIRYPGTTRAVTEAGNATAMNPVAPPDHWPPTDPQDFLAMLTPHAAQAARRLGVDTHVLLAQCALETGWGKHVPRTRDGQSSFNLFGIKTHGSWQGESVNVGTLEFRNGIARREQASFRAYASPAESFNDYVNFLQSNPRYREALASSTPQEFIRGLQQAGYATDPAYAAKVLRIRDRLQEMAPVTTVADAGAAQVFTRPAVAVPEG